MSKRLLKDWDEIQNDFEVMQSMSCVPTFKRVPANFIFDENKSVKWNKDMVAESNANHQAEVARLNTAKNKARDEIYEDIYYAIQCEIGNGLTREGAMAVWGYAYELGHAYGIHDIMSNLYDILELIKKVLNSVK